MLAENNSRIIKAFFSEANFLQNLENHIRTMVYKIEFNAADGLYRLSMPGHHSFPTRAPMKKRMFSDRQREVYEPVTTAIIDFLIAHFEPENFYDIGASNGYFSLLALSTIKKAPFVHSFEISPFHVERMKDLAKREAYVDGRWDVNLAAIADRYEGTRPIWISRSRLFENEPSPSEYKENLIRRLKFWMRGIHSRDALRQVNVVFTSIDRFASDSGRKPDLIKVDIDGYEGKFIDGTRHLLSQKMPFVLLEVHRDTLISPTGYNRLAVFQAMFDLGYRALYIKEHNDISLTELQVVTPSSPVLSEQDTQQFLFY
jgi:FkbM family methyltransferase